MDAGSGSPVQSSTVKIFSVEILGNLCAVERARSVHEGSILAAILEVIHPNPLASFAEFDAVYAAVLQKSDVLEK